MEGNELDQQDIYISAAPVEDPHTPPPTPQNIGFEV